MACATLAVAESSPSLGKISRRLHKHVDLFSNRYETRKCTTLLGELASDPGIARTYKQACVDWLAAAQCIASVRLTRACTCMVGASEGVFMHIMLMATLIPKSTRNTGPNPP